MKTFQDGAPEKKAVPFWAQHPIHCKDCNWKGQLEPDDEALVTLERAEAGGTPLQAHVYCPHCGQRVSVVNPDFIAPAVTDAERIAELEAQLRVAEATLADRTPTEGNAFPPLRPDIGERSEDLG